MNKKILSYNKMLDVIPRDAYLNNITIKNTMLYALLKKLTGLAEPTQSDRYDKRWNYFYLPVIFRGRKVLIPVSIVRYKSTYFLNMFSLDRFPIIEIRKGNEVCDNAYHKIVRDMIAYLPQVNDKTRMEENVPFYFREGKIKRKYIMEKVMLDLEAKNVRSKYERAKKNFYEDGVSLNEYLDTAYICYRSSIKNVRRLRSLEAYKKYSDGRDGGMLSIKNKNSRAEFMAWQDSGKWGGSHPFEIVFSWFNHGILLYPPSHYSKSRNRMYSLHIGNMTYANIYIKMILALIKNRVGVDAPDLDNVLGYLTGESYARVNEIGLDSIFYGELKRSDLKHVEWDSLSIARPKPGHSRG